MLEWVQDVSNREKLCRIWKEEKWSLLTNCREAQKNSMDLRGKCRQSKQRYYSCIVRATAEYYKNLIRRWDSERDIRKQQEIITKVKRKLNDKLQVSNGEIHFTREYVNLVRHTNFTAIMCYRSRLLINKFNARGTGHELERRFSKNSYTTY